MAGPAPVAPAPAQASPAVNDHNNPQSPTNFTPFNSIQAPDPHETRDIGARIAGVVGNIPGLRWLFPMVKVQDPFHIVGIGAPRGGLFGIATNMPGLFKLSEKQQYSGLGGYIEKHVWSKLTQPKVNQVPGVGGPPVAASAIAPAAAPSAGIAAPSGAAAAAMVPPDISASLAHAGVSTGSGAPAGGGSSASGVRASSGGTRKR